MTYQLLNHTIAELYRRCPAIADFFASHNMQAHAKMSITLGDLMDSQKEHLFTESATARDSFVADLASFMVQMQLLKSDASAKVESITVIPGVDKSGTPEPCGVTLKTGEITAVVGPTGSGKSRLLEDLECLAQKDTPTKRRILINNVVPDEETRFGAEGMVAQLSQNMNFVMDLQVSDFLTMHAESRMVENVSNIVQQIFATANELSGEAFTMTTAVTQLSGGQSRALMIADTALLSAAPIILIDEIENAGVDKIKALALLIKSNKIVLISTHDPLLALNAHRRVVIRNGGIHKVVTTTKKERANVHTLQQLDALIADIRWKLRNGEEIVTIPAL
ncbi:MAG: ATP-binding cassette domain-containing protein [Deltaproteobacteria bacterium]|nr:ATP-binding cassette domain-containing protein [Deltaproteobacteria bacterium]